MVGRLFRSSRYEDRFSQALLSEIRPGDIVWDVGANVGFYTMQFSEVVGPTGQIVAFEPNPACVRSIEARLKNLPHQNIKVISVALGNQDGKSLFALGSEDMAVDSRLVSTSNSSPEGTIEVEVMRGDTAVRERDLALPNILKIDIEGYELECLEGLTKTLGSSILRAAFVEVHFGILEARGMPFAPTKIEELLRTSGLSKQRWLDASHIVAMRN